jgi:hypothetical protein
MGNGRVEVYTAASGGRVGNAERYQSSIAPHRPCQFSDTPSEVRGISVRNVGLA